MQRVHLVDSVCDVAPALLRDRNVRGIICDLDNTLVAHGADQIAPEIVAWLSATRQAGIRLAILSNSRDDERVARVARDIFAVHLARARKPLPAAFERARGMLSTSRDTTIVVGDKLFTDILGSRLAGLDAILVRPIVDVEEPWMMPFRLAERLYLRCGGFRLETPPARATGVGGNGSFRR